MTVSFRDGRRLLSAALRHVLCSGIFCFCRPCPLNRSVFPFPIWNTAGSPRTPASDRRDKLPGARIYIEDWRCGTEGNVRAIAGNGDFGVGDS